MKSKILNFLLILTSLLGYLEWSNQHTFLFQAEWVVLSKLLTDPMAALHPLTVLPLVGQMLLIFTLFQKQPSKILTFIAIGCLGLLLGFMFIIGLISVNFKIIGSTVPFLGLAAWAVKYYKTNSSLG
jgi:hypothetical protein